MSMNWVIFNVDNGFIFCLWPSHCQLNPPEQTSTEFEAKYNLFPFNKMHLMMLVIWLGLHGLSYYCINFVFLYHGEAVCVSLTHTIFGSRSAPVNEVVNGPRSTQITCCLTFTRLKSDFIYCIHTVHTIVSINFLFTEKGNYEKFWIYVLYDFFKFEQNILMIVIPPAQRSCVGSILVSLHPSLRPSVRPSVPHALSAL